MDGLGIVFVGVGMIYMEFIYTEDESKLQMFIYKYMFVGWNRMVLTRGYVKDMDSKLLDTWIYMGTIWIANS